MRDFLNAEEVADIILELMKRKATGTYNIASGKGIKIKDFVQSLTKTPIKIVNKGEQDILVADVSKLNKLLKNNEERKN